MPRTSLPVFALMEDIPPCSLVLALGPGWVASEDALPWNDHYSHLRYMVYSPSYGRELFVCKFSLSVPTWWSDSLKLGIGGVTHWRLATAGERDFTARKSQLPGSARSVSPEALEPLRHWWAWFAERHGIDR